MGTSVQSNVPTITVCGLGPGGSGDITQAALTTLHGGPPNKSRRRFIRTSRHPTAALAGEATSFDPIYDSGSDLASVYKEIAETLIGAAQSGGDVVYAVPGSPLILERSVAHLRADPRVNVELVPSMSFLDVAWARLGIDPVEERVRLIDGHTFAAQAVAEGGPLLVAHAHARWVLSDIKLAVDAGPEMKAVVMQGLGTVDERVFEVEWPELDRSFEPDHLTTLYLPEVTSPIGAELQRIVDLVHQLRQQCPWDAEQTHESLQRYLVEETYEVMEALDAVIAVGAAETMVAGTSAQDNLCEELGDLLFQIMFHAELASEAATFTMGDVASNLRDKLVARHPHVFGDVVAADAAAVESNWETIKKAEKGRESIMDGIPAGLPALSLAEKILTKADRSGAAADDDWLNTAQTQPFGSTGSELSFGETLLGAVEHARRMGIDPESALRAAALAAKKRFTALEGQGADRDGKQAPVDPRWIDSSWVAG